MSQDFVTKDMEEVLSSAFLEYAGYNLQRRAIPDARDGLKWGARQLLHAQMLGKFTYDKPFKKAIKSVSQAMGFSYVHGDSSAYGTFIRMAKPFAYRYPLQEVNGNYGTLINPDDHSASRYVELRGSELAAQLLKDLDKNTVNEWEDTYDLEGQFPKVLPSKGFWGLTNGCISIGSGMSCSVPPFNLKELNTKLVELLWNPEMSDEDCVVMPDFPTGATILNSEEVKQSLINGTGSACKIRATVEYDDDERCLIVTEMPYSTYTNTICKEIDLLMEENDRCGIREIVDYTGRKPDLRIYLTKSANPDKVLKLLYKETSLQTFYSINLVLLDEGKYPKVFRWKEALLAHLSHEKIVYRRAFEYDLNKIEARLHIIEGLLKAMNAIDEVVDTIKKSPSVNAASTSLQLLLNIDAIQAKAILDLKLSRLSKLDVNKLVDEQEDLINKADNIKNILNDDYLFNKEIEKGLTEVANKFGDDRRTKILNTENEEDEPLEKRRLSLAFTNYGAVFVTEVSSLYAQKRGGKGTQFKLEDGEYIIDNVIGDNLDSILFFGNLGNFYPLKMDNFIIGEKQYLTSLIDFKEGEKLKAAIVLNSSNTNKYITFVTKNGLIKKSEINEYNLKMRKGSKAIKLDSGDEIVDVSFINNENIGILTYNGYFVILETEDIRPIGRITRGIIGVKLSKDDFVIAAKPISNDDKEILITTEDGYGIRNDINDFRICARGSKGTRAQKDRNTVDFLTFNENSDIMIVSNTSRIVIKSNTIRTINKGGLGVKLIKLKDNENVVKILKI